MKYILILLPLCLMACEKKTSCKTQTVEFLLLEPRNIIANQASEAMTKSCGGAAYNVETIGESEKRIVYTFSCPNSCN